MSNTPNKPSQHLQTPSAEQYDLYFEQFVLDGDFFIAVTLKSIRCTLHKERPQEDLGAYNRIDNPITRILGKMATTLGGRLPNDCEREDSEVWKENDNLIATYREHGLYGRPEVEWGILPWAFLFT